MSAFQTAAIAAAAALALALISWLLLCLRTRRWRAAAVEHLAQARRDLEAARRVHRTLEQQALVYPDDAPPPYGPVARALHQALRQARGDYTAAAARCAGLGRRVETAAGGSGPSNPLFDLLGLGLAWRHWRAGSLQGEALNAAVRSLEAAIARSRQQLATLRDMPGAALRRSRDLHRICERIAEALPTLHAAGLEGPALDRAIAQARDLCAPLSELPPWCVPGREMPLLDEVTQDSTMAAWQILDRLETPLRAVLEQLEGWQTAYEQAGAALRRMQQALQTAGQRLRQLPDHIEAGAEMQRLGRLIEQGTALETRYDTPHVEDLASLRARIDDLLAGADALAIMAETAERAYAYLRQAIPGNTLLLRGLANRMDEAARMPPCLLDWGDHYDRLLQLRRLENEIGPVEIRRTPAQLKGHADMAAQLAEAIEELEREAIEILRRRDEWVALTGRPEMALPLVWLQQAQELHRRADRYAAINWPREIDVAGILHTARDLEAQYRRLMPPAPGMPVSVSAIGDRLERLKGLMAELDDLGHDLRLANERLAALQTMERQANEEIERVDQALEDLLDRGAQVRPPFAGAAGRWHALRQAYRRGDRLAAGLEGKQRRRVEDQVRLIQAWAAETHRALAAWVDAAQGEVNDMIAGLRQEVAALDALAPFEREPAMAEARAQLGTGHTPGPRPAGRPARDLPPMEELAERGQKLLVERARLQTTREALRNQIGGQVHPERERLERLQREAREAYETLLDLQRACRAEWPPLRCDTHKAAQEWEQLERERERLRRSGSTVRDVVYELRRLAEHCQALESQIRQQQEQTKAQRQELQKQVERLHDWQERLAAYRRAHRDETAVAEAVGERLREIESLTRRAQGRHRQSELTIQEARQVLDELWSAAHADLPVRGQATPLSATTIESN